MFWTGSSITEIYEGTRRRKYLQELVKEDSEIATRATNIRQTADTGEKGYLQRTQLSVEKRTQANVPPETVTPQGKARIEGGQRQQKIWKTAWQGRPHNEQRCSRSCACSAGEMATPSSFEHTVKRAKYLISLSSSLICIFSTALVRLDCFFWEKQKQTNQWRVL